MTQESESTRDIQVKYTAHVTIKCCRTIRVPINSTKEEIDDIVEQAGELINGDNYDTDEDDDFWEEQPPEWEFVKPNAPEISPDFIATKCIYGGIEVEESY